MENAHGTKRRKLLGIGVAVIGGAMVAPAGAQAKKVAKAQVQYQDSPKNGQKCDACLQFVAPSSCKLVDGDINAQGWCLLFVQKPS